MAKYYESHQTKALIKLAKTLDGPHSMLLSGPPGCGKTAFSKHLSQEIGARYLYYLLHSWSDDQELFYGVDIPSAITGDSANVRQPGVLALAASISKTGKVVVCLDEIDKVMERTEYLLLDFLQSGRVPLRPGEHIQANLTNLIVVATTNDTRPLSDATLRRFRRVFMSPLPKEVMANIASESAKVPLSLAKRVTIAAAEEISLQEITNCCRDIYYVASSYEEAYLFASQWLRRDGSAISEKDMQTIWGECLRHRR